MKNISSTNFLEKNWFIHSIHKSIIRFNFDYHLRKTTWVHSGLKNLPSYLSWRASLFSYHCQFFSYNCHIAWSLLRANGAMWQLHRKIPHTPKSCWKTSSAKPINFKPSYGRDSDNPWTWRPKPNSLPHVNSWCNYSITFDSIQYTKLDGESHTLLSSIVSHFWTFRFRMILFHGQSFAKAEI